jgi:hypothetical protein
MAEELEVQTALALQEHLRACPECVAFLHTYRATLRATRSLRDEDAPPTLQRRVLSFLHDKILQLPPER